MKKLSPTPLCPAWPEDQSPHVNCNDAVDRVANNQGTTTGPPASLKRANASDSRRARLNRKSAAVGFAAKKRVPIDSLDVHRALTLSYEDLCAEIVSWAQTYEATMKLPPSGRSAGGWASYFPPRNLTSEKFLAELEESTLAGSCAEGRVLARLAGALAWTKREDGPPKASIASQMKSWTTEQKQNHVADFVQHARHCMDIEGLKLEDPIGLAESLRQRI
jgi:hypothetical protein